MVSRGHGVGELSPGGGTPQPDAAAGRGDDSADRGAGMSVCARAWLQCPRRKGALCTYTRGSKAQRRSCRILSVAGVRNSRRKMKLEEWTNARSYRHSRFVPKALGSL